MTQLHEQPSIISNQRLRHRSGGGGLSRRRAHKPLDHESSQQQSSQRRVYFRQPSYEGSNHSERSPRPDSSFNDAQWFDSSPVSVGDGSSTCSLENFVPLPFRHAADDGASGASSDASSSYDDSYDRAPYSHHCRDSRQSKKSSMSDCISISSDQAVIAPFPITENDSNDDEKEVPATSLHISISSDQAVKAPFPITENDSKDDEKEVPATSLHISISSDQAVVAPLPITKKDSKDDEKEVFATSLHNSDVTNTLLEELEQQEDQQQQQQIESEEWDDDSFDLNFMPVPPTKLSHGHEPQRQFHRRTQVISLPNYRLGQEGRLVDMRVESTQTSAQFAVASLLREFDAAFIRRSNGRWTYAILAQKIVARDNIHVEKKAKLRFVVDDNGSTKNLSLCKWGESVRLVREPVEANALLDEAKGKEGLLDAGCHDV